MFYERKYNGQDSEQAQEARKHIEEIKKNRQRGQPYVSLSLNLSY